MSIETKFPISTGISIGDAITGANTNQILTTDGSGNLSQEANNSARWNIVINSGGGTNFLADDGTYKAISTGISIGQTVTGSNTNAVLYTNGSSQLSSNVDLRFDGNYLWWDKGRSTSAFFGEFAGRSFSSNESAMFGYTAGDTINALPMTAVGTSAGQLTTNGDNNTIVGRQAGYQGAGARCTYMGYRAGYTAAGNFSVAIGDFAGYAHTGANSTFVGANAGNSSGASIQSTMIGSNAGLNGTGMSYAVAVGSEAGSNASGGSESVFVGRRAGQSQAGNTNIFIGSSAGASNNASSVLAIGASAGASNTQSNRWIMNGNFLPQFAGAAAAAATLPAGGANGYHLYWDTTDNTIKVRP